MRGGNTGPKLTENLQRQDHHRGFHSKFVEPLQDLLRTATQKGNGSTTMENIQGHKRDFHSEFIEPSRNSLGTLNEGKS